MQVFNALMTVVALTSSTLLGVTVNNMCKDTIQCEAIGGVCQWELRGHQHCSCANTWRDYDKEPLTFPVSQLEFKLFTLQTPWLSPRGQRMPPQWNCSCLSCHYFSPSTGLRWSLWSRAVTDLIRRGVAPPPEDTGGMAYSCLDKTHYMISRWNETESKINRQCVAEVFPSPPLPLPLSLPSLPPPSLLLDVLTPEVIDFFQSVPVFTSPSLPVPVPSSDSISPLTLLLCTSVLLFLGLGFKLHRKRQWKRLAFHAWNEAMSEEEEEEEEEEKERESIKSGSLAMNHVKLK